MDNRYELASQYGMSKEYIDWFFDKMKDGCGNQWFIMMAAMWEGWQASREAMDIELTPVCWRTYYPDTHEESGRAHSESNERCARRIASEIGGYVVPVYHGKPQSSLTPANDIANGTGTE